VFASLLNHIVHAAYDLLLQSAFPQQELSRPSDTPLLLLLLYCVLPSPTTRNTSPITAGAISSAQAARHLKKVEPTRREKDSKDTQASAYSYSAGNDPGGWGDAFTWYNAEASASSGYNGVYYNDGECKCLEHSSLCCCFRCMYVW
jgi:hypothetical protein